nr:unnamed protein product [Callosobruchus chinensis]
MSWMCKNCRESRGGTIMRRSTGSTLLHIPLVSQCSSAPAGCSSGSAMGAVANDRLITMMQDMQTDPTDTEKISDFEAKLLKFDEHVRKTKKLIQENHELKTELANLQNRLNDMVQHSRTNNIEIQGVPEKLNENLREIVKDIGKHVNCDTNADIIDYIHRVQHSINSKNKIKSIIVRFTSRYEKEKLLASSRIKRNQSENRSTKISIGGLADAIYINEHLTLANKILFKEVRLATRNKSCKYTWTKNGSIFARKDDTSRIIHVNNTETTKNIK